MSKGWVHWHPDGYTLDIHESRARSLADAFVWYDEFAASSWKSVVTSECEVITYEDAQKRLAEAVMKATAEELRKEREAAPKPIANPNMAPNGGSAKPTESRMMVEFRLDPSKYRVGVRKVSDGYEVTISDMSNCLTLHRKTRGNPIDALHDAVLYSGAMDSWVAYPHPWKRADGSRIKASWEE